MCSGWCSLAICVTQISCLQCPASRLKEACLQLDLIGNKELSDSQWLGKQRQSRVIRVALAKTHEEEGRIAVTQERQAEQI